MGHWAALQGPRDGAGPACLCPVPSQPPALLPFSPARTESRGPAPALVPGNGDPGEAPASEDGAGLTPPAEGWTRGSGRQCRKAKEKVGPCAPACCLLSSEWGRGGGASGWDASGEGRPPAAPGACRSPVGLLGCRMEKGSEVTRACWSECQPLCDGCWVPRAGEGSFRRCGAAWNRVLGTQSCPTEAEKPSDGLPSADYAPSWPPADWASSALQPPPHRAAPRDGHKGHSLQSRLPALWLSCGVCTAPGRTPGASLVSAVRAVPLGSRLAAPPRHQPAARLLRAGA